MGNVHNDPHAIVSPRRLCAACRDRARRGQQRACHGRSARPRPADTGKFLETILTQLRRAGLIRSQRGPTGFLAGAPGGGNLAGRHHQGHRRQLLGVRGERPENITYPGVAEPLQQVWIALRANERAVLEQVTLADIVSGNLPDMIRNLTENPSAWV
jgi:Predicted transcriptional regulator